MAKKKDKKGKSKELTPKEILIILAETKIDRIIENLGDILEMEIPELDQVRGALEVLIPPLEQIDVMIQEATNALQGS